MNHGSVQPLRTGKGSTVNTLARDQRCFHSICEYDILFLSCTGLFETLAKCCTGEAIESWLRSSSVISIKNILAACHRCGR